MYGVVQRVYCRGAAEQELDAKMYTDFSDVVWLLNLVVIIKCTDRNLEIYVRFPVSLML